MQMYGPIEIRNTTIVLHNYTPGDNQRLENTFSIWNKTRHRRYPFAMYFDSRNKDLYVPGGTSLYTVSNTFMKENIIPKIPADPYDSIGQVMFKKAPRDERQRKAIRFCVGLDEFHMNRNLSQLALNLNTGAGKTYVALFTFAFFGVRTICIMNSADWARQWAEKLLEYSDVRKDEIYFIEGSPTIHKLINGMRDITKIRIIFCTHATLQSWAKKNGWKSIGRLFKQLRIGIKIYDEAHLNFINICKIDFFTNVWKTFYLTATPQKSDFFQNKIYQKAFETVPKIDLFDEELDPHTSYLAILINSHPSGFDIDRCANNQYGFSIINYTEYFIKTDVYFKILRIILMHCFAEMEKDEKVLIYIATNDAISATYRWLKYYYWKYSIGVYTSLTSKNDKPKQLESTIILTTTKSAGVLLDIPKLKKTVIFNEPFNSYVYARQILGRTRDNNTELIEVVDCGFQRIKDWYRNKVHNVYSKYATEVNQINYTDQEINQILLDADRQEREDMKKLELKAIVDINGEPLI